MPQPDYLQKTISELNLGTYDKIKTIQASTSISEALNIFVATRVSALPVVDENQRLINIYSKFDVIVSFFFFIKNLILKFFIFSIILKGLSS